MKVNIIYGNADFSNVIESYIKSEMEKRVNAGINKPSYNKHTHGYIS